MNLPLEDVVRVIDAFIRRTRGRVAGVTSADTKLFQEGLLDSFAVAELILELERASGAAIADGALIPDDFESPRILYQRLQEI